MSSKPRIVLFDLETLPDLMGALKHWPSLGDWQGRTLKASITTVCCFGYMIHGEKKAKVKSSWDFPSYANNGPYTVDDLDLCLFAYDVLKDADVVVTQNGKAFDWKYLQTRIAIQNKKHKLNLPQLPKIVHIDTKLLSKANLLMYSNSLKHLAEELTNVKKMDNEGWPLWVKTFLKDPKAMAMMAKYCRHDVQATDEVFKALKPFAKLPNFNLFRKDAAECCPNCGGFNFRSEGTRTTLTRRYRRTVCKDCGTWAHLDLSGHKPRAL